MRPILYRILILAAAGAAPGLPVFDGCGAGATPVLPSPLVLAQNASSLPPTQATTPATPTTTPKTLAAPAAPESRAPETIAVRSVWEQYIVAQKRFEHTVYGICSRKWPDLDDTLRRRRDHRLARLEMRNAVFSSVCSNDPGRIPVQGDVRNLDAFEFSPAESDSLAAHNPLYARMRDFADQLAGEEERDPRTDELRARLAANRDDRALLANRKAFSDRIAALNEALQTSRDSRRLRH